MTDKRNITAIHLGNGDIITDRPDEAIHLGKGRIISAAEAEEEVGDDDTP